MLPERLNVSHVASLSPEGHDACARVALQEAIPIRGFMDPKLLDDCERLDPTWHSDPPAPFLAREA
jgi:hypothetical protein